MKIIYIGAFRFPIFDAAAARVLNIGKSLRDAGHEVSFISWGGQYVGENATNGSSLYDDFTYFISGELNETDTLKKIVYKFSPGSKSIDILKQVIGNVDVVIAYNPDLKFNRKMLKLSQRYGFKYVVDITEWYDNNELKFIDFLPNWYNMTRFNLKKIENRILISSFLDHKYNGGNNIIIPATCDSLDDKWRYKDSPIKTFKGITLIYAGTPAKKDKLHEVINTVERIQNEIPNKLRLLVLGIERNTYLSRYSKFLESIDLSDAIVFLGRVSQDEVPSYYAHSDFMVLLRDSTRKSNAGFPTKFAESMMSGTPVIANLTSDLGRYLIDGYNGYIVDSPTSDSLYEVLFSKVVNIDSQKLEEMHEKAKKMGIDSFDYRGYVTSLSNFINNLL